MYTLKDEELREIEGGSGWAIATLVVTGVTFIVGIIAGWVNPAKCK